MAPFSDTINHHNVDSSYDIIKAEWRPIPYAERVEDFKTDSDKVKLSSIAEATVIESSIEEEK